MKIIEGLTATIVTLPILGGLGGCVNMNRSEQPKLGVEPVQAKCVEYKPSQDNYPPREEALYRAGLNIAPKTINAIIADRQLMSKILVEEQKC